MRSLCVLCVLCGFFLVVPSGYLVLTPTVNDIDTLRPAIRVNNLTDSPRIHRRLSGVDRLECAAGGDILTLMAGRSVSMSFTVGVKTR